MAFSVSEQWRRHPNRSVLVALLAVLFVTHPTFAIELLRQGLHLVLLFLPGLSIIGLLSAGPKRAYFYIAPFVTFLAYLPLFVILFTAAAPAWLFAVVFWLLTIVLVSAYCKQKRPSLSEILPVEHRLPLLITLLLSFISMAYLITAAERSTQSILHLPAFLTVGIHMPGDNVLPFYTAQVFKEFTAPWNGGAWTMGDRPPLMALWVAIDAFMTEGVGHLRESTYLSIAVFLSSLFIFPLYELVRRLSGGQRVAIFIPFLVFIAPVTFLNTFFTWPKSFGSGLLLCAIAFYLNLPKEQRLSFRIALLLGAAAGLAALTHGAATLSLPVLYLLYLGYMARHLKILQLILRVPVFFAAFMAMGVTWSHYKHIHPEIDTFRLIGHYCNWEGDFETYPTAEMKRLCRTFFTETPLNEQWRQRKEQVTTVVEQLTPTWSDLNPSHFFRLLAKDEISIAFYRLKPQFDAFLWPMTFIIFLSLAFARKFRKKTHGWAVTIFALSLVSLFANIFLKWRVYMPHEGPYTELLLVKTVEWLAVLAVSPYLLVFFVISSIAGFVNYISLGLKGIDVTASTSAQIGLIVTLVFLLARMVQNLRTEHKNHSA